MRGNGLVLTQGSSDETVIYAVNQLSVKLDGLISRIDEHIDERNARFAVQETRIALLEERLSLITRLMWLVGGALAAALVGHLPTVIRLLGV